VSPGEAEKLAARWWEPARNRAILAALEMEDDDRSSAVIRGACSPAWVPVRREPSLPSMWKIVQYWVQRDEWFVPDVRNPHCFACERLIPCPEGAPEYRWNGNGRALQRGHLVNRARDGLDQPQNLVPLCKSCNRVMPMFGPEAAQAAIDWVLDGGIIGEMERRGLLD
jgi:hypothetical protein